MTTPIEREALSDDELIKLWRRSHSLPIPFARALLEQAATLADAEVARLSAMGEHRCALAAGVVAAMIRAQT